MRRPLADVTGWKLGKTGLVSAVPYLLLCLTFQTNGFLVDLLRSRFGVSTTRVRKICVCCTYFVQMLFVLILSHNFASTTTVVVCLTVALAVSGFGGIRGDFK